MIRIAVAVVALLCFAAESQAQVFPNFQPFGGRFRPCQPVFPIFPRCQPQFYYSQCPPTTYYVVPSQPYQVVPSVPNGPMILPAPQQQENVVPKTTVVEPKSEGNKPRPDPNPAKVTNPAKPDDGPRILPAPKRN